MCFIPAPDPPHLAKVTVLFSDRKALRTTNLIRVFWHLFWDMLRLRDMEGPSCTRRTHTRDGA